MTSSAGYLRPASVEEAVALKAELGEGAFFGCGLTAAQLAWRNGRPEKTLLDISSIDMGPDAELRKDGSMVFAANARLEPLRRDPLIGANLPVLSSFLRFLGSTAVRNQASIGGNLLWGSGDLQVLFSALGARLSFADVEGDFALHECAGKVGDALLAKVIVPPLHGRRLFAEKLGYRQAFSPSQIVVAGSVEGDVATLAVRFAGRGVLLAQAPLAGPLPSSLFPQGVDAYLQSAARNMLRGHLDALASRGAA